MNIASITTQTAIHIKGSSIDSVRISPRRINKIDGIAVGEGIEIGGGGMPEGIGGDETGGFGVLRNHEFHEKRE